MNRGDQLTTLLVFGVLRGFGGVVLRTQLIIFVYCIFGNYFKTPLDTYIYFCLCIKNNICIFIYLGTRMIAIRKTMDNPVKKVLEKPLLNWERSTPGYLQKIFNTGNSTIAQNHKWHSFERSRLCPFV